MGRAPRAPDEPAELVFEGVSARVAVGPFSLPALTVLCFRFRGVRYELLRPRDLLRTKARISPRQWTFAGKNDVVSVEGELWGDTKDFVGLRPTATRAGRRRTASTRSSRTHAFESRFPAARLASSAPPLRRSRSGRTTWGTASG